MVSATTMIGLLRMCANARTWTSSRLSYNAEVLSPPSLLPPTEDRPISASGSSVGDDDSEHAVTLKRDRRRVDLEETV
jgi:hypothetical protein